MSSLKSLKAEHVWISGKITLSQPAPHAEDHMHMLRYPITCTSPLPDSANGYDVAVQEG